MFVAGVDKQGRVKLEWKDKPGAVVAESATEQEVMAPSSDSSMNEGLSSSDE